MFKRSLRRGLPAMPAHAGQSGSSIVAALTLVGILSITLLLTQIILPDVNRSSQKAEAGSLVDRGYTKFNSSAPKNCAEAKEEALNQLFGPEATNADKGQTGTMDACFGAYSTIGKPSKNIADYKCVGRAGTAIFGEGIVTVKTNVSQLAPEGKCIIAVCQNGKCAGAKTFAGVSAKDPALTPGSGKMELAQGDGSEPVPYHTSTSDPQAQALDAAFNGTPKEAEKSFVDSQINQNKADLEKLRQYINSCTDPSQCPDSDRAFDQVGQIEAKNAALKERSDKLAGDIKSDLDPNANPTNSPETDTTKDVSLYDCRGSVCYASSQKAVDALNNQGYTCQGAGDYSVCSKQGAAPSWTGKDAPTPPCTVGKCPSGAGPGPGGGVGNPDDEKKGGGLGNIGQMLQGALGGLMKGLGGAGGAPAGPACPSDPSAYAQQQQQYQQQMQQYQYQMQQYQYQQRQMEYQAQVTGYVPMSQPLPPTAPVACTPGAGSNTCAAAPPQPAAGCPAGTVIQPVKTNQSNGSSCTTSWQCAPSNAKTPTAELSCQPKVADVGMSVTVSYGCTDATSSTSGGFSTLGATSGSTTTVITAPPAGVNKATFGLTCINQNLKAEASCDVQVSKPSIVLLANPKVVATSSASTIGWVTSGMSSCVVSSPQQADFTAANAGNSSVNGMATTSPITQNTDILLHCITLGGGTRDATTTIMTGAAGTGQLGAITITSSADGKSIARGAVNTIQWTTANAPSGAKMSLWLYDVQLGAVKGRIRNDLAASASFQWTLPKPGDACAADLNQICSTDLVPGKQYGIEADLYTGTASSPVYSGQAFTPEVFTVSQ